jgi:hypothetical protein
MPMDQLNQELTQFLKMLKQFDEGLAKDWDSLQYAFKEAERHWTQDETRRRFEKEWGDMGNALRTYRQQHSKMFEEFLTRRKKALDHYFGK